MRNHDRKVKQVLLSTFFADNLLMASFEHFHVFLLLFKVSLAILIVNFTSVLRTVVHMYEPPFFTLSVPVFGPAYDTNNN